MTLERNVLNISVHFVHFKEIVINRQAVKIWMGSLQSKIKALILILKVINACFSSNHLIQMPILFLKNGYSYTI